MNYHIDRSAAAPAYLQLYYLIRKDIISGAYAYGSRMPSKRVISAETGISIITVEHALSLLCEEGYLEARPRSGCYVIYREADFQGSPLTDISQSAAVSFIPPAAPANADAGPASGTFPYSIISKTMRKVLSDYGDRILIKSPNSGCDELKSEICSYLARSRGIIVHPHQVVIGSGAEYLYSLIAQLFGADRSFALEDPSYDKIRKVYTSFGIRCDALKLGPDGITSTELEQTDATVLHVTPFNSFPSGITASISKKHEYLSWAKKRNAYIVEDNFDSEMTVSKKTEDPLFSMSEDSSVIYINTFSKTIAPSIRIGYMILPEKLIAPFEERLGFYSCTVPVFEQYVLAELMRSGDFERHINRVRRQKRKL